MLLGKLVSNAQRCAATIEVYLTRWSAQYTFVFIHVGSLTRVPGDFQLQVLCTIWRWHLSRVLVFLVEEVNVMNWSTFGVQIFFLFYLNFFCPCIINFVLCVLTRVARPLWSWLEKSKVSPPVSTVSMSMLSETTQMVSTRNTDKVKVRTFSYRMSFISHTLKWMFQMTIVCFHVFSLWQAASVQALTSILTTRPTVVPLTQRGLCSLFFKVE